MKMLPHGPFGLRSMGWRMLSQEIDYRKMKSIIWVSGFGIHPAKGCLLFL
jgi:hypothetical protein